MVKLVFFAPYPNILPVIQRVISERPESKDIQYQVVQDYYNNKLEHVDGDVIIARGFTAHTLKRRKIPCVELKTTGYDVLAAVKTCLNQWDVKRIAVVGAFNMVYGAEQVNQVYPGLRVSCYAEDDEIMLKTAVLRAKEDGNQVIVGGYSTVELAKQCDVPAVMIRSGREAVNQAITEALALAAVTVYEREKRDEIASIMNYSFQGIISVNRKGMITLANSCCYSYMKERKEPLTGADIREVFPGIRIEEVIHQKKKILSEVCDCSGRPVMVNCVPVSGESQDFGAVITFQGTEQIQAEEGKLRKRIYSTGFTAKYDFTHILYKSSVMEKLIQTAEKYSYADSNILIHGETGTGKELFAQSIHNSSPRRKYPFVAINCAALPENLLESELFGYVEGAFTGAARGGKMGFFEIAHRGTIFLDEIGDISPKLQSRLLRVLQEREIVRLGNDTVIPIDVRVICATNRNLRQEVEQGNFRRDLLYRLDVLELHIPPLRERRQDIPYLVRKMTGFEHERTGCVLEKISEEGMELLKRHDWPGNVREIRNFCERICILCERPVAGDVEVRQALPGIPVKEDAAGMMHKDTGLAGAERQALVEALERFGYNRARTAAYLEIDKSTLWRKMKKYNRLDETKRNK
ncbi:sigma 54-interacting transcriptional regulator [Enterocloster aldenensis]|uniref:Sigma 54-interacting transcriptional regulator n=1 Tax=Enterocloster aldenensis TaxID=358742 RepID=A0AAW5BYB6_9FIRM|nr:sigma 54-interacting transcriptional regulator [Enterocloster aldenensis]